MQYILLRDLMRSILLAFIAFIWCGIHYSTGYSEPKKVDNVRPGECAACHGDQRILPSGHVKTEEMTYKDCLVCHQKRGDANKPGSLRGKLTISHLHGLAHIDCSECHGKERPIVAPEGQKCLDCHADYRTVPTDKELSNPHQSHMGDLDCLLCHHAHMKSENFCAQCHWWKYRVP